jgi:hypothetical protein
VTIILAGAENLSPRFGAADDLAIGFDLTGQTTSGPQTLSECDRCIGNAMTGRAFRSIFRATRARSVGVSFSSELPAE